MFFKNLVVTVLSGLVLAGCAPTRTRVDTAASERARVGDAALAQAKQTSSYLDFKARERAARRMGSVTLAASTRQGDGVLDLHFIDVGQGDATLIGCPNGKKILVDVGSKGGGDPEAIRDYIWEQLGPDEPHLDALVITHADGDHFNLVPFVLDGVALDKVVRIGDYTHYATVGIHGGYDIRAWLASHQSITDEPDAEDFDQPEAPGDRFDCGGAEIYLLAANTADTTEWWKNTRSIVLKISFGDFDAILTGDATFHTEAAILDRYPADWLASEVLKVGHHGSRETSTSPEWAAAVQPQLAVASAGEHSAHGHPSLAVVERLKDYVEPWSAHVMVSASGKKPNYKWHYDDAYEDGFFNTAASGTIVVSALSDGSFEVFEFDYE